MSATPAAFIEERPAAYAGFATRELVVRGTGPTIVLLHGFGHSADAWRPVLSLLHDVGQAALAVDLPGFAQADPLDTGDLLPQHDAFTADVVRQHAGTDGVVVVGNSLGAALAARAARNTELPVIGVMPLGIAGITWKPLVSKGLTAVATTLSILSSVPRANRIHPAVTRQLLTRALYGDKTMVDPDAVRLMVDGVSDLPTARRLVAQGTRFKIELDRVRDHGGVGVPMIVVHGLKDILIPVSAARILHAANPSSQLVLVPRSGHCPQLDAPQRVASLAQELATITTDSKEIT